ncbi:MAG TPA: peptidase S10 [Thermoanaerobaculia bacterium]|nr:peptidase S10 [Thermoanaerobaculia bacterium]
MPERSRFWLSLYLMCFALLAAPLTAQQPPASPPDAKTAEAAKGQDKGQDKKPAPEEKSSRTQHSITLDGQKIPYTATAGTILLKDEDGTPKASVFSIAYTRDGVKDPGTRPVTFAFNGGPGSASLWVHMGAFGPKRVERDPEGMALKPPGRMVDNEFSLLDTTDLVFIDPVDTGYSRTVPGQDPKQFHGVLQDVQSVGEFIRLWVTRNQRWASPKFIAGESYGTTRAAGLARYLDERYGMQLNGVVLVSSVLNWQNQEFHTGNDMPYIVHLPTYAATAWYHKKLAPELEQRDLRSVLEEVEEFSRTEYAQALLEGDRLSADRRKEIAAKVAHYSGLSPDYVERTNLRIDIYRFVKELLRDEGKTVGRLDTRFTGRDLDSAGENFEYDPASASVGGPYVAAANDYIRRELNFQEDLPYEFLSDKVFPWSFEDYQNQYLNMAEYLRQAMVRNPDLKVLITAGYYDLATPYYDAFFTVDHLNLPPELRDHIRITTYEAGHMMYIRASEHRRLKQEIVKFIGEATR